MKRTLTFVLAFSVLVPCGGQNRDRLLNDDWRFVRDSLAGAEAVRFDDASWKTVDLPHDFSLEPLPAVPARSLLPMRLPPGCALRTPRVSAPSATSKRTCAPWKASLSFHPCNNTVIIPI